MKFKSWIKKTILHPNVIDFCYNCGLANIDESEIKKHRKKYYAEHGQKNKSISNY